MEVAPARKAAYDVLRRVAEEGAYADRALRTASAGSRRSRPGARTTARLRLGAAPAHARSCDRDAREAPGAKARSARAGGIAPRRVPARLSRRCAEVRRRERVGRARAPREPRAGRSVHERGAAASLRGNRGASRGAAGGAAQALLPGLDLGRLAPRPRGGGSARPDARSERATTRRCQTRPGTVPGRGRNGHPERLHRRTRRRASSRRGPDLAAEPRLAARRARRRLAGGGARPRPLRGAGREGDDARGRRRRGRGERSPGARARGERPHARRRERARRPRRRARAAARADRHSTGPSSTRRARGSVCSRRGPICAGARRRSPSFSSTSSARQPSARGPAARSSTPSARSTRTRPRRWSTPPAWRSSRSRAGRSFAIAPGRSSCRRCRTSTARAAFSSPAYASSVPPA